MGKFVKVALPIPTDQLFTYKLNRNIADVIGKRVIVPLMNRSLTGIIVDYDDADYKSEVKDIIDIPDDYPLFSENMLKLTRWISEYYMTSWGETLKSALPPGFYSQSTTKICLTPDAAANPGILHAVKSKRQFELIKYLMDNPGFVAISVIEKSLDIKISSSQLHSLQNAGIIETESSHSRTLTTRRVKMLRLSDMYLNSELRSRVFLEKHIEKKPVYARIFSFLYINDKKSLKGTPAKTVLEETKAGRSVLNTLIKKGIIREYEAEIEYEPNFGTQSLSTKNEIDVPLTEEQQKAVDLMIYSLEQNLTEPIVIHGVTGSGKTILYMKAIQRVIELGKTALILVPEIALTPQLIDRFRRVFRNQLAVLHSGMKDTERYESWNALRKGEFKIALGARSALFAPLHNLGLIIVDEEHDTSYKQDSPAPRYQARDCAVMRGKIEDCLVVLGSATPSIESMYNTQNKYKLAKITSRADGAKLPKVILIDSISANLNGQMKGSFCIELLDRIISRYNKKEGVIILQNRRGFASVISCNQCGHTPECKYCSVKLTYHKTREAAVCHYCGYSEKMDKTCSNCGSSELALVGSGTQRIEIELAKILADMGHKPVIRRMDSDSVKPEGALRKILASFSNGETDILVGTQMLAKGIDIDRVSLIGVINADIQLFLPDFRSSERTFQLLTQISGRAGRQKNYRGEVIIQSHNPNHYAVKIAAESNYDKFYKKEIKLRKEVLYPPFVRFISIEFNGIEETKVISYASRFASLLPKSDAIIDVMGPVIPTIAKISDKFRRVIYIKSNKTIDPSGYITRAVLREALKRFELTFSKNTVMMKIDIDSYSSL